MEIPIEPGLDTAILVCKLNELMMLKIVGAVDLAASIDNMVLLEFGRCMGEDKDLPSIRGGVPSEHCQW
eukprot:14948797-Ditylum_brightwellii.AAC.1